MVTSDPKIINGNLAIDDRGVVSFTNELLEDQEIDLASFIQRRVAEGFARAEDVRFLHDSSNTGGMFYDVTKIKRLGNTSLASINDENLGDILADIQEEVPESVRQRSRYLMSFSVFNRIRKIKDSQKNPIFKHLTEDGETRIHGKPVIFSEVLPAAGDCTSVDKPILAFGDFERGFVLGYKGGISITRADTGTIRNRSDGGELNLFREDLQAVRFTQRVGSVQVLSNTVVILRTDES